jgi:ATPase subunit of ABC transporter with duplicated ATPase domains
MVLLGLMAPVNQLFLKMLCGDIEYSKGHVEMGPGETLSVLRQNHSQYNDLTVLSTVLMGHTKLWDVKNEKDSFTPNLIFSEEDGLKAAELESLFAEMDGWDAESNAASLLSGLGIGEDPAREINE